MARTVSLAGDDDGLVFSFATVVHLTAPSGIIGPTLSRKSLVRPRHVALACPEPSSRHVSVARVTAALRQGKRIADGTLLSALHALYGRSSQSLELFQSRSRFARFHATSLVFGPVDHRAR